MCNVKFKNLEHENFYSENLPLAGYEDGYHRALIYLLGVSEDTRTHFKQIYNIDGQQEAAEKLCGWLLICTLAGPRQ